jgi:hypothetical protein
VQPADRIGYGGLSAPGQKIFFLKAIAASIAIRGGFSPTALELVVGMVIMIMAGGIIFGCTSDKVRQHGEAYALALFEAIETVVSGRGKTKSVK